MSDRTWIWQHAQSGAWYGVRANSEGELLAATGPIGRADVREVLAGDFASDPALLEELTDHYCRPGDHTHVAVDARNLGLALLEVEPDELVPMPGGATVRRYGPVVLETAPRQEPLIATYQSAQVASAEVRRILRQSKQAVAEQRG